MVQNLASIIVVNWNGEHLLDACLKAIREQTYRPFEVIVVDNASSDGSCELLGSNYPDVRLIRLDENRGFAGGNNAGFLAAKGEFIALVNNDVVVEPQWLERLISAISTDPRRGVCASRVMIAGTACIDSVGEAVTTAGNAYKLGEQDVWGDVAFDAAVTGGSAAAILYRRSMLQDVGVFDEDFYLNVEDSDLHLRAWLAGWGCCLASDAVAHHSVSMSIGRLSDQSVYYLSRNSEWFWIKNFPLAVALRYFHHRIAFEFLAAVHFCLVVKKWRPYLHGKWSAVVGVPRMLAKRRGVQALKRRSTSDVVAHLKGFDEFLSKRVRQSLFNR